MLRLTTYALRTAKTTTQQLYPKGVFQFLFRKYWKSSTSASTQRRMSNNSSGMNHVTSIDGATSSDILMKVIPLVDEYLKEYSRGDSKVVEFLLPEELKEKVDFEVREEGVSEDVLLELVKKTMKYSIHTCHPRFSNCLWSGVSPLAVAAQSVVAATNTSMYTYEMAPVYNLMEQELVQKMCQMVGFENGDGIFTPGGSISNMFGLMAARFHAFPETKQKGIKHLPQMVIFASMDSHYSVLKSASTLGIGSDNVIKIKTDDRKKMLASDLEEKVVEAKKKGNYPLAVVATSATTVVGAYDPLNEIADVCERHKMWLHVDAAWGGSVLMSDKHKHLMDGIHRVDSVTWDSHKMLMIPLICSSILLKHKGLLAQCNSTHASYLFQKDKLAYDPVLDTGDRTIQCGRVNDAFKFWLVWKARGRKGFERIVDNGFIRAGYLADQVRKREGFELIFEPECMNVCFYYIPPTLRGQPRNQDWLQKLNKVAPYVKAEMVRKGSMMFAYQPLDNKPNFFRMITVAPTSDLRDMDFILDEIVALGEGLKFTSS